ncbi:MAG: hypothetical protein ACLQUY_11060 [Ktedonobacterales bacterium]
MREDLVTPATARRLAAEGFTWEPELGDWCTVLGAEHIGETRVGLWLIAAKYPQVGQLGLVDATGEWPASRVPQADCLWLPTIGKLKVWLRSRGFRVTTGETATMLFGAASPAPRHLCRLTREDSTSPVDGEGSSEAEALADAILRLLGAETADSSRLNWH